MPQPALEDFETALERKRANVDARCGRAVALARMDRTSEAIADITTILKADPVFGPDRRRPFGIVNAGFELRQGPGFDRERSRRLYHAACVYATAAGRMDRPGDVYANAERAIDLLQSAVEELPDREKAKFWRDKVRRSPMLRSLWGRTRMAAMERAYGTTDRNLTKR
jgi:hypothetical protein